MVPPTIKRLYVKLLNGPSNGFHPEFCGRQRTRLESRYPELKNWKVWW